MKAILFLIAINFLFVARAEEKTWEYPEDIPEAIAPTLELAGSRPAGVLRYLLSQGARGAELSPDGKTLAFIWAISGVPQLWTISTEGGFPTQLTFGESITFFKWTPSGKDLLISKDDAGNERESFSLLSADGTREDVLLELSSAFRRFGDFSADGSRFVYASTERNGTDFDVMLYNIETRQNETLHTGTFGFFPVSWQPNGNKVIVTETRGEDGNNVYLLEITTGQLKELFVPKISANFSDFAWKRDGSGFFLATNLDREFNALAFYSIKNEKLEYLIETDRDISNVVLSNDNRKLAWTENDDGFSNLRMMDAESFEELPTPDFGKGVYQIGLSAGSLKGYARISGPKTPGDVLIWDLDNNTKRLLVRSSLAGLSEDNFVEPTSHRFVAQDGVELQGLLYAPDPIFFGGKRPAVVQVHGGPTAQSRPSFRSIEQFLVNQGIAVFAVNVRGSTGFGKTYARLDNKEKRLDSVRDLADTVKYLSSLPRVSVERTAVMGGSYGGYMVNAVLGSYPNLFNAGVSVVGVSDWVRALEEASPALKASDREEYGDIREERWQKFYTENSPINNVSSIRANLLVAHGANDPRDPVSESDRLVSKLRNEGRSVRYLRFPDEGHSFRKLANRVIFNEAVGAFLLENLRPDTTEIE